MIGDTRPLLETWLHFLDIGYGQEQNHQNTSFADKPSYLHSDPNREATSQIINPSENQSQLALGNARPAQCIEYIPSENKPTSVSNDCPGQFIHITHSGKISINSHNYMQPMEEYQIESCWLKHERIKINK